MRIEIGAEALTEGATVVLAVPGVPVNAAVGAILGAELAAGEFDFQFFIFLFHGSY